MSNTEWWHSFFDDLYADQALQPIEDEGQRRIYDALMNLLNLTKGSTVLDQCAGIGRLSIALASRGVNVHSVEISPRYVERAKEIRAQHSEINWEPHQGDGFTFVAPVACDAVINWYSSFGYVADDAQNAKMLRCAFESLKPGGQYLLDYISIPWMFRNFQACIVEHIPTPKGEVLCLRESSCDFPRGMIVHQWTYLMPDGSRSDRTGESRMIMPHELIQLLLSVGFSSVDLYGSIRGEPFDLKSMRCICIAHKE